ncbi:MAG TPA: hypothetical protein VG028_05175 [Terriglobia bacterium]|nr:hypothetical protein [Terriglobia bacterium]
MHKRRKRTEITVETEETFVLRSSAQVTKGWCPECALEVSMAMPEVASTILNVLPSSITKGIKAGQVHSPETPDGRRMVCLKSLLQWTASSNEDKARA